jgi:hypothetical protein
MKTLFWLITFASYILFVIVFAAIAERIMKMVKPSTEISDDPNIPMTAEEETKLAIAQEKLRKFLNGDDIRDQEEFVFNTTN